MRVTLLLPDDTDFLWCGCCVTTNKGRHEVAQHVITPEDGDEVDFFEVMGECEGEIQ